MSEKITNNLEAENRRLRASLSNLEELLRVTEEIVLKQNQELEERIRARTAQLMEANEKLEQKQEELEFINKNLEVFIRDRTQMLEESNRELKETQMQLMQMEKMSAIGQLAAGVAHEINNPMAGILGYSQFMLDLIHRKGGAENLSKAELAHLENYLQYIEEGAKRCQDIVSNLLKYSRLPKTGFSILDINYVIKNTLSFTKQQLQFKEIEVIYSPVPGLPEVLGNEFQLEQVFTNMILNAQQSMERGGKLTISAILLEEDPPCVEINFADNGCGIPKEFLSKVFDPFFTTKPVGEGTGLGLSVSLGIIEAHNGQIFIESKEGVGTTVKVKIPVSQN